MGGFQAVINYYMGKKSPKTGLIESGNISLGDQPVVKNADGTTSTVRSMSFTDDKGRVILVPTVAHDGSGILSDDDAWKQYLKSGKHLGVFGDQSSADVYAKKLHEDYATGKIKMKKK